MERRYRLSGTVKFSSDMLIFDNEQQAMEPFKDIYLEIGGVNFPDTAIIEKKVEDLGPAHWNDDVTAIIED